MTVVVVPGGRRGGAQRDGDVRPALVEMRTTAGGVLALTHRPTP